jgi:hypothetical protein
VDDLCSYPNNPLSTDTRTRRVGSPASLISTRAPRQHLDPGPSPTSGPHGQRPHLNYSHPERLPTRHPGPLDGLAGSRRGSLKYHRRLPPLAILPSNFPFRIFSALPCGGAPPLRPRPRSDSRGPLWRTRRWSCQAGSPYCRSATRCCSPAPSCGSAARTPAGERACAQPEPAANSNCQKIKAPPDQPLGFLVWS